MAVSWSFFSALLSIITINLVRSVDNAMVVAVAMRYLPKHLKLRAIVMGSCVTIVLSVLLTFFIAKLLDHSFIKFTGGMVVLYLAVTLFVLRSPEAAPDKEVQGTIQALKIIVIANISMSLDNMLAVAGASNGNIYLLFFGLGVSIPIVFFASSLLAEVVRKYPVVNYLGCAVLGKVGAEMIVTDPVVTRLLAPSDLSQYAAEAVMVCLVIVAGKYLVIRAGRAEKCVEEVACGEIGVIAVEP